MGENGRRESGKNARVGNARRLGDLTFGITLVVYFISTCYLENLVLKL